MKKLALLIALAAALVACKKDEQAPCIVADDNFVIFPKTGIWVDYTREQNYKLYDTTFIGTPRNFTAMIMNDTSESQLAETHLFYPVISKYYRVDTLTGVVELLDYDTIAYVREDAEKKRLYRLGMAIPIDSSKYEYVNFDYNAPLNMPQQWLSGGTVVGRDSLYFNNRFIQRSFCLNTHGVPPASKYNPNIQGLDIGTVNHDRLYPGSAVWNKLLYNGQEFKVNYKPE